MTITLPADKIDITAGQYEAEQIAKTLHAAYWMQGRADDAALYLLTEAHKQFAQMADAMGYTIARKTSKQAVAS